MDTYEKALVLMDTYEKVLQVTAPENAGEILYFLYGQGYTPFSYLSVFTLNLLCIKPFQVDQSFSLHIFFRFTCFYIFVSNFMCPLKCRWTKFNIFEDWLKMKTNHVHTILYDGKSLFMSPIPPCYFSK